MCIMMADLPFAPDLMDCLMIFYLFNLYEYKCVPQSSRVSPLKLTFLSVFFKTPLLLFPSRCKLTTVKDNTIAQDDLDKWKVPLSFTTWLVSMLCTQTIRNIILSRHEMGIGGMEWEAVGWD